MFCINLLVSAVIVGGGRDGGDQVLDCKLRSKTCAFHHHMIILLAQLPDLRRAVVFVLQYKILEVQ